MRKVNNLKTSILGDYLIKSKFKRFLVDDLVKEYYLEQNTSMSDIGKNLFLHCEGVQKVLLSKRLPIRKVDKDMVRFCYKDKGLRAFDIARICYIPYTHIRDFINMEYNGHIKPKPKINPFS